jgi:hypothetical protein
MGPCLTFMGGGDTHARTHSDFQLTDHPPTRNTDNTQDGVTLNPDRKSKLGGTGPRPRGGFNPGGYDSSGMVPDSSYGAVGKQELRGAFSHPAAPPVPLLGPTQQHGSSRFRGVMRQGARWKGVIHFKGSDFFLGCVKALRSMCCPHLCVCMPPSDPTDRPRLSHPLPP